MFLLHRTRCLGLPGLQDGDCRPADAFLRGPDAARRGVLTRKGVAFTVNRLSFRQPFVCAPGTTTAIKAGELCEPFSAFLQRSCWPLWLFRPDVRGSEKPPVAQGRGGKRHQRHEVRISQGLRRRKKLIFRRTRCARLRARSRIGTADSLCARRPACGSDVLAKAPGRVPTGRARRASGGFRTRSRVPSCRRSRARRRTARPNAEKLRHVQRFRTDGQRVEQSVGPHVFCFRGVGGAARPRILHRTQMLSGVPKLGAQRPTRCILPLTPTTFAAKQTPRIRRFKPVSAFLKRTLFQLPFSF